jgi:ankyrin repeat protein
MRYGQRFKLACIVCMAGILLGAAPRLDSPIADAAMRNDIQAVRTLLRAGADVNAAHGDGMTALHWAAENGDADLAQVLIAAGANPRSITRLGQYTPLHLASKRGSAEVIKVLLKGGASPNNVTSSGGASALHLAAMSGSAEAVAVLVEAGAAVDAREAAWGHTPLMFAASNNYADVVRVLMRNGADASITGKVIDIPARSSQDRADEQRQARIRRMLAGEVVAQPVAAAAARPAAGVAPAAAQPNTPANYAPLGYADLVGTYGGLTALLFAAREGKIEAAMALIEGGADINQPSAGDGSTPLLLAVLNGRFDMAAILLERGGDPNLKSAAGTTPLYGALQVQWQTKSRHPQPVNHPNQAMSYLELMEKLLDAGADPNVRLEKHLWHTEFGGTFLGVDEGGATPFWRAAYGTDVAAMRMLVAHGADPNIPSRRPAGPGGSRTDGDMPRGSGEDHSGLPPVPPGGPGVFPIHVASGAGYGLGFAGNVHQHAPDGWLPSVKYLIEELGADVNTRDYLGYTALHNAAARGDNEMIRYLVEKGGDVMVVSREGQTTVDMANGPAQRISPFPATIQLLESLGAKNNNRCVSC